MDAWSCRRTRIPDGKSVGFEVHEIKIKMDFLFRNPLALISLIHQLCQLEIVYCWLSFIKMEHWLIKS